MQAKSRAEAKLLGLQTFMSGKPCPQGHIAPRKTRTGSCVECARDISRNRYSKKVEQKDMDWKIKYMLTQVKKRARKRDLVFEVTADDIVWNTHCPVLGIKLDYFNEGNDRHNWASLDRTYNDQGYVPGNVVVMSYRANFLKNNMTAEELKALSKYFLDIK